MARGLGEEGFREKVCLMEASCENNLCWRGLSINCTISLEATYKQPK